MLKKVDAETFDSIRPINLSLYSDFVETTANCINAEAVYFLFYYNELVVLKLASFKKKNKLIFPNIYPFYSGFWLDSNLPYNKQNNVLDITLKSLKKEYKSIVLMLPTNIYDVRSFIWNDFEVKLRYTYVKNLNETRITKNLMRDYKTAEQKLNFSFREVNDIHSNWFFFEDLLTKIGFSLRVTNDLRRWVSKLQSKNLLKLFTIYDNKNNYMGSSLILLDDFDKVGNFLLIHTKDGKLKSNSNVFLKANIQYWLKENNYKYFDYLGANNRKISEYKNRFSPELKSYYIVNYRFDRLTWVKKLLTEVKSHIKNINNKIIKFS